MTNTKKPTKKRLAEIEKIQDKALDDLNSGKSPDEVEKEINKSCKKNIQKPLTRGVILIACGHPYYGNYACQLAAGIKFASPDTKITVLHDKTGIGHLNNLKSKVFDQMIEINPECYKNKGRNDYLKIKTWLYDLSPYDETIFIDSDVLWLPRKSVNSLFDILSGVDFTMANRGKIELNQAKNGFITWCNPAEIIKEYGESGILYNLSSEFIYFRKTPDVEKLFRQARRNFENLKVNYVLFGNDIPDELPFGIAMMQTGVYPHTSPFLPFYWEQFQNKNLPPAQIYQEYYAYSCGGAIQNDNAVRFYNNLAQFYCNKLGLGNYFPLISKRRWLPNRVNI